MDEEAAEDEAMEEGAIMGAEDEEAAETIKGTTGTGETMEVAIATGATRTTVSIIAVETTMVVVVEGGTILVVRGTETMNGDSSLFQSCKMVKSLTMFTGGGVGVEKLSVSLV